MYNKLLFNFYPMQDLTFENPFYKAPIILISASHDNSTSALWDNSDNRYSNALNIWMEVNNQKTVVIFFPQLILTLKFQFLTFLCGPKFFNVKTYNPHIVLL